MNNHPFITHLRNLIAKDQLPQVFKQLQTFLRDSPDLNQAILQSGRFADIQKQINLGTVSFEAASITKNQIRLGLLNLLDELEGKGSEQLIFKAASQAKVIQNAEKIYNIDHIDNANFS